MCPDGLVEGSLPTPLLKLVVIRTHKSTLLCTSIGLVRFDSGYPCFYASHPNRNRLPGLFSILLRMYASFFRINEKSGVSGLILHKVLAGLGYSR